MQDRFKLLLENPHKTLDEDPKIFVDFIPYVLSVIDSDPATGKPLAHLVIKHAPTSCQRIQGWGMWAQIHRSLNDLDEADFAIKQAFFIADDCDSCVADLHRRRAVLRRARKQWDAAIEDADESIQRYEELGHSGHDLHCNGLADAYNIRAGIHLYMSNWEAAIQDEHTALSLLDPRVSPVLYRLVLANLAISLYYAGDKLLEAEKYLKKARRLFSGVSKQSQERAKLDWLTAQVRYKLGKAYPYELRGMMERARADFLALGLSVEAVSVGSDLMKMKLTKTRWGRGDARDLCRDVVAELLELRNLPADIIVSLHQVSAAIEEYGWHAKDKLKESVDQLREACGPNMMACLLTWEAP